MPRKLTDAEQAHLDELLAERDRIYDQMSALSREMTYVAARIHEIRSGVYEQ